MGSATERLGKMDGQVLATFVMVPEGLLQDLVEQVQRTNEILERLEASGAIPAEAPVNGKKVHADE